MKRQRLFDTEVLNITYVFWDIYNSATEQFQRMVDDMTDEQLSVFANNNLHEWSKGMRKIIDNKWDVIARQIAEDSVIPNGIKIPNVKQKTFKELIRDITDPANYKNEIRAL